MPPLRIPVVFIRDKQAFAQDMLSSLGKPIDVAKRMKEDGFKLIHIVDLDALNGNSANLDIYDKLTYFINVQVECAPKDAIIKKLLSLKCRIVLDRAAPGFSLLKEKNLLVAKITSIEDAKKNGFDLSDFHDIILENASDEEIEKILSLKKRVLVLEQDYVRLKPASQKLVWGIILSSSS